MNEKFMECFEAIPEFIENNTPLVNLPHFDKLIYDNFEPIGDAGTQLVIWCLFNNQIDDSNQCTIWSNDEDNYVKNWINFSNTPFHLLQNIFLSCGNIHLNHVKLNNLEGVTDYEFYARLLLDKTNDELTDEFIDHYKIIDDEKDQLFWDTIHNVEVYQRYSKVYKLNPMLNLTRKENINLSREEAFQQVFYYICRYSNMTLDEKEKLSETNILEIILKQYESYHLINDHTLYLFEYLETDELVKWSEAMSEMRYTNGSSMLIPALFSCDSETAIKLFEKEAFDNFLKYIKNKMMIHSLSLTFIKLFLEKYDEYRDYMISMCIYYHPTYIIELFGEINQKQVEDLIVRFPKL